MAVHLRLSQNFSELKSLAAKWLVPEDHIQDFISGKRAQLAEIPLEEKEYSSAVEKLREEMWLLKDQMFTDIVSRYLIQKAEENPAFSMQVLQKHKTIQKCMNYIMEQAYSIAQKEHEKRVNGKQPVTGREQNVALGISEIQVYQWAEDYYALDDAKQEADKKEKEQKKRISKQKKSVQQNGKKKTSVKTSPTIPAKNSAPAPAKKKKEENIQLSMFDMMQLDNE